MSDKVDKALRERAAKKRDKEQKEKYSFYKESSDKVDKALEGRKKRIQSNLGSIATDIQERYNSAIDSYNDYLSNNSSLASGTYSEGINLKSVLNDQRERSLAVSKLIRDIEAHRSYLGDGIADKVLTGLTSMGEGYKGMLTNAQTFSQYRDKKEYDAAVEYSKFMNEIDADELKAEIDELEARRATADETIGTLEQYWTGAVREDGHFTTNMQDVPIFDSIYNEMLEKGYGDKAYKMAEEEFRNRYLDLNSKKIQALAGYKSLEEMDADIYAKREIWGQVRYYQEGVKLSNEALNAEDFDVYAEKGASIENPSFGEAKLPGKMWGTNIVNKVEFARENEDELRKQIGLADSNDDISIADAYLWYTEMTPKEVSIYNYYLAKYGEEKADEYLYTIEDSVNHRIGSKTAELYKDNTFLQYLHMIPAGIDQANTGLANAFNNSDKYVPTSSTQYASQDVRESIGEKHGVIGTTIYDLGTTTFNMVPSIAVGTVVGAVNPVAGAAVGSGLMGLSAKGNAYVDKINAGWSVEQAQTYSTIVGVSESSLQFVLGGIGKLGGTLSGKVISKAISGIDNAAAKFVLNFGGHMAAEGIEEGLQSFLEPFYENAALGYAKNDLEDVDWGQVTYDALLGALAGGIFEGGGAVVNKVGNHFQNVAQGYSIMDAEGGVDALRTIALDRIQNSSDKTRNEISKLSDKVSGEKVKASNVGKLYRATSEANSEQNKADIVKSLERKGFSSKEASSIAEAIVAQSSGQTLTKEQAKLVESLKGDERIAKTLNDVVLNEDSTVGQRTADLSMFDMGIANGVGVSPNIQQTEKNIATKSLKNEVAKVLEDKKIEVADDGKTTNLKTNKAVEIKNIESISESGEVNLTLDDKTIIKASDVAFGSEAEALFIGNIGSIKIGNKNISTASANALYQNAMTALKANPNMTATEAMSLIKGLEESYIYGAYNLSKEKLSSKNKDGSATMFAGELTQSQRDSAYELGSQDKVSKVEAKQKDIDDLKAKGKPSKKSLGKVIFEDGANVDESTLTATQKANLNGIKLLAELSSVEFHIFKSEKVGNTYRYTAPDGTVNSANGWYVAGTNEIWVDLNAGNFGEGTMIRTAAHEISHYIKQWSPKKWQAMADLLMEEFARNGVNTESMLNRQIAKIKRRYSKENMPTEAKLLDMAYEELVSDALSDMLTDGSIVSFMAEVKAKDRTLWQKIKDAIENLLKKWGLIIEDYKGRSLDTAEAQALSQLEDTFKKLQAMYQEAFMDANEVNAVLNADKALKLAEVGIGVDEVNGEVFALRDSFATNDKITIGKKSFDVDAVAELVSEVTGRSIEDSRKWVQSEMTVANLVMRNPEFLDFEADDRYEAIKKNSDYPQGTVDLSNNCPKRAEFTSMFDVLQKQYPNKLFTAQDVAEMRSILADNGITVACGACFVEDRRQLLGEIADTYINMWKEAVETGKPLHKTNAEGKKIKLTVTAALAKQYSVTKGSDIIATDTYIPTQYDLTTYEGFRLLEKNHPTIAMGYNRYNNSRGQQSGRLIEGRAEYKRQILGWSEAKVKSVNNNGGLRIFSFSDFEVVHLLDLVQVIIDCAAKGVKIQGYTKIPAFAKLVRNTGIKLNRSFIPKGETGVKVVNGKKVLDIDTTEGIDINDENFLDESDNPDVGNVIIGINPEQIGISMLDDYIDYIIPFHSNKAKAVLKALGLESWVNYKESQHEKDIATGKASKKNVNIYTQVINKYNPTNKVEFVEAFLKECKKQGKIPRYAEFLHKEYNADGTYHDEGGNFDYTYREGYHKFLVDFKMFDKEGNILPQGQITPELDNAFMTELLNAEVDKKANYEFPQEVYDQIEEKFGGEAMLSERVSNEELASMDETALYIKNTKKANYIGMIFNGTKTEETRSQRTLDAFIGKDFYVTDGKMVYGSIVLGEPYKYTEAEFHKLENRKKHRVPKGDEYDVKPGGIKWAYPIESYNKFDKPKKLSDSKEYKNSFQAREVMYSVRGESTATEELDKQNLETAKKMDETKVPMENIRLATGWYKQSDGNWRSEFSSKKMRFKPAIDSIFENEAEFKELERLGKKREKSWKKLREFEKTANKKSFAYSLQWLQLYNTPEQRAYEELEKSVKEKQRKAKTIKGKLADIIYFPELFRLYPQLKDVDVVSTGIFKGATYADWSRESNTIRISKELSKEKALDSLTHEIQHAIQDIEGFEYEWDKSYADRRNEKEAFDAEARRKMSDEQRIANPPVMFSDRDSSGRELSKGQQKYFAKSKVRDRYGNLLRLFHGSAQGGFTIFDPKKSDDKLCLFLTDTIEMAESYSGSRKSIRTPSPKPNILRWLDRGTKKAGKQQGVYEVYANITNPMVIEAKGRNFNQLSVDAPNTKDVNLKVAGYENDMRIEITIGKENYVEYFYNFDEAMNFVARKLDKGERSRLKAAFFKGGFINIDTSFKWDTERNQRVPYLDIRDIAKIAKERGHDGVIVRDVTDYDNRYGIPEKTPHGTVVVAFKSNQIKDVHNPNPTKRKDIRYSERDSTYMDAVNNGDMKTAQRLVDEAAKEAGYNSPKLYHGTEMFGFTKIKTSGVEKGVAWSPFFATNKEDISASYVPYGRVRDIASSMDDDSINEAIEIAIEEKKENISELVYDFRRLIDRHFSPWVFGQTDNSYLERLVENANPEAGNGDGVYDVLSEIVYDTFYDYEEEFGEYEDADDWFENSPEGNEIFSKIDEIEGEKLALHRLESGEELGGIYQMYANLDNMYVVDGKGAAWNELRPEGLPKIERYGVKDVPYRTRDVAEWARDNGFDGAILKNIRDNGAYGRTPAGDVYVFFHPESQVKSADPVTYDDNGNVIPLSERFNKSNDDIRYSEREVQPITEEEYKDLEKHFGTTGNFKVAGYLLTNGKLLDFSGKHWGDTTSRSRQVDHRDVQEVIGDRDSMNGTNAMIDMIGSGNVRLMPEIGGINLAVYPNEKQRRVLSVYINYMLNTEGEIVIDYDAVGGDTVYSKTYGKTATSKQILSDIRNYFNGGRQSELMQFHTMYSERDPKASNRSILANALEGAAQNDIEKNKLAQYKEKIALIETEEQRLSEIQKQLFTKGGVDPSQRKELQFEAKQIANRINTYDRQLLNLEATTALKNVLSREKALAMKRQKQKDAEAMRQYKEKVAKTTRELMDRHQASRKKAIEGREKTAMRHKIQKVVGDLNNLLLKPTKERHVPEELRVAVAEALDLVNMDTVNAEERLKDISEKLQKETDPIKFNDLLSSYNRIMKQGDKMSDKLTKLKEAYETVRDSKDDSLKSIYDDVIYDKIGSVQKKVGNTPLRNMTLEQLENVYDLFMMVLTTVRDSNKAFAENVKQSRLELGSNTFAEIKENNKARDTIKFPSLEKFMWQNLKPMQAIKTIGSETLQKLWNNILYGQETFAVDYDEAVEFAEEMKDKYGYEKWNKDKLYSFGSKSGKMMKLNLEQMMSIYAYSKRKQADEHIEYGGIVLNEGVIKVKNKLGKTVEVQVNDSTAYRLDKMQVANIVETLDKEFPGAKGFVDEMQKYLSDVMGEKGNEVSMKMYRIKLFKEEHYFPLKSSKDFMEAANAKLKGDVKIKNKGMTKEVVPHARNPIVLEGFLDVWGNHVNEMAMYHGLVLPLEDFSRTLSYSIKADDKLNTDAESVRNALHEAFGENADNYLNELLKAINGGVLHDSSSEFADNMVSKFKKAKVLASLSVIVQQPTAIIRAMAMIEPKYFLTTQNLKHKATWEELKKYCPTAIIKETGSFDTNMGKTIVDMVKEDSTFTEKIGDTLGKAPAYMDEVGWNMIWRALKKKIATEQKLSGEELLKEAGKQMTLIINETQVYDSVMSRNELMRSKSTFTKMATSFMAEPTTVANMIYGAALDFKRGKKGVATKAVAATITSVVINGLVSSMVYALRDDDEEKTLLEKYLSSAVTETIDGLNPLTYIPFIKDAYSLFQGYDVERTDMALIGDVKDAIDSFYRVLDPAEYEGMSEDEIASHIYNNSVPLLTSICDMFGLPVGNILRDAEAIIVQDNVPMSQTTSSGIGYALKEGLFGALPEMVGKVVGADTKGDKLYDAIISGDTTYVDRLKSGYKDDKAYESAVRSALRENDPRIKEAAEARIDGDIAEYTRIVKAIKGEGNFVQDTIVAAVNAEINALNKGEDSSSTSDKTKSMYKIDDYFIALDGGDEATAYLVKEDLINTDVANGKDREEAEESFISKFTSHLREQYEEGNLSDSEAQRMLVNFGEKTEEEAASKVQYWDFKQEYPDYDDLSEEAVDKYYTDVEPYGITVDVYYDYSKQRSKCKGVDANGDGKTDSGSKKAEIMQVINSLPISRSQKDVLYYLNGWSAKTIYEAPWH